MRKRRRRSGLERRRRALQSATVRLGDASDPLGKLQRGLGSGYLWALDADRAVSHALLVHCVFNDRRASVRAAAGRGR